MGQSKAAHTFRATAYTGRTATKQGEQALDALAELTVDSLDQAMGCGEVRAFQIELNDAVAGHLPWGLPLYRSTIRNTTRTGHIDGDVFAGCCRHGQVPGRRLCLGIGLAMARGFGAAKLLPDLTE